MLTYTGYPVEKLLFNCLNCEMNYHFFQETTFFIIYLCVHGQDFRVLNGNVRTTLKTEIK